MIIRQIQTDRIKKISIRNSVKNGIAPVTKNIKSIIKDYTDSFRIGCSNSDFIKIDRYSRSDPKSWNACINKIASDVDVMIEANNNLKQSVNKLGTEVTYLQHKSIVENKKISKRIYNLGNILASNTSYSSKSYIFDDFQNIEFYSDKERNLPNTTAFIDLPNKRATNFKNDYQFSHITLENSDIKFNYDSNGEVEFIGELNDLLKDTETSYNITTESNIDVYFTGEFEITMMIPTEMNTIRLRLSSMREVSCSVRIEDEDGVIHTLNTIETVDTAEWNFIQKKVTKFYINISKKNSMGITESKAFITNIIINKIDIFNDFYNTTSTMVTKKINYPQILDSIKLEVNETIISGTNIEYFAAIDNGITPLNWINIKNGQDNDLKLLYEKQELLNKNVPYFGHAVQNNCYIIGSLNKHYNSNSIKLLSGYQQWNVEILSHEKFNSNYELNMSDYNKDKIVGRTSIDYESYKISLKRSKIYAMSTVVYCDKSFDTKEFYINPDISKGSTFQAIVIFNNNIVKKTKGTYKFAFREGRNKINILLFSNQDCTFTHNMNFKTLSQNCGHGGKLKQVSESYLKNNVNKNNDEYFCIDSNGNILIKINPNELSEYFKSDIEQNDINFQDYTRYFLNYKFLPKENYHLCLKNNIANTDVRFMAIFNSENIFTSPQLYSYTLKGR